MNSKPDERGDDDSRVLQAAQAYFTELEAGRQPDRRAYLARYPDLASALAECLDGIELVQTLRPKVPASLPEYPANPLGDFQILRELGRGGMGVVYEAVQLSLGRRVALKILPFAAGLNAKHLQRFKTEAHAAAQLHHTNIVPVHYVGCERGVHFYAMQLIDGRSLDAVIRELRGHNQEAPAPVGSAVTADYQQAPTTAGSAAARTIARSGRGRQCYRTAAQIAVQVAEALQYAHDAGVVHRDIKPANLLLDAKGTVWVMDFGLAHVTADVGITRSGEVVGTLRYMSPEQAAGRGLLVDHRTDVYSLGATLYELLALEPIFPGQNPEMLRHQIRYEDPRPLRRLDRGIPVELETIVLKALAKSPAERYATAAEMAADLRRFLDERPILARRPSPVDRVRKWMRRHPTVVGAVVLLLVFVMVGLAITTALVAREQARTRAAYDREMLRAREAEQQFRLARQAADDMIQLAEEGMAAHPHLESLRKQVLEAALVYYQQFIEQRQEDPKAQAELEVTRDRVRKIVEDLTVLQGVGQIFLLREEAARNDLRLSAEQRAEIADLSHRLDQQREESLRRFRQLAPGERRQRSLRLARMNQAAVEAILSPEQLHRLRQIALQCKGPAAFFDPDVATGLKLTAGQRERIWGLQTNIACNRDTWLTARTLPRSGGYGGGLRHHGAPSWRPCESNPGLAMERILALLTQEQVRRWDEMIGEPFAGPMPVFFTDSGEPVGHGPGGSPVLPRVGGLPSGGKRIENRR